MLSIVILGTGNVANHLFDAFEALREVKIKQVVGRNLNSLQKFKQSVSVTTDTEDIFEADLYIVAVSDEAIGEVSKCLEKKNGLVVHTSGSKDIGILTSKRKGVFYPLQTFTKNKSIDFSTVPICIEAENENDYEILEKLAKYVSQNIFRISSKQRQKLHLSAVLVNNFPNHLYYLAYDICIENKIPFQMLYPLIFETVDKIRNLTPEQAQTGPAKRNDVATMQYHLEQLRNPLHKKIYQLLSESIKRTHEKKL